MTSIAVGLPVSRRPSWELVESLTQLCFPGPWRLLLAGQLDRPYPIAAAYERLVTAFLATDDAALLFLNDDAVLHPETVLRLWHREQPIVGALALARYRPYQPAVYSPLADGQYRVQWDETRAWLLAHPELYQAPAIRAETTPEDLVEVGFTGLHCLLVHREVLEAMHPPYFGRLTLPEQRASGVDRYFCEAARAQGYRVLVDRSVLAGHQAEVVVGGLDFLVWAASAGQLYQVGDTDGSNSSPNRAGAPDGERISGHVVV